MNQRKPISFYTMYLLILSFSGCMSALVRDTGPEHAALLERNVNEIESIELNALSQTPPVSIDQAADEYVKTLQQLDRTSGSVSLDIDEIRLAALVNNLELKAQLYSPTIAQEALNVERAKFETVLFGGINHLQSESPTASQLESSEFSSTDFNVGLAQPLPTGGDLTVVFPSSRSETNNQFSLLNPSFDADLRFSISQPLLRGAGFKTNTHSIRVARFQKKIADAQTKLEAIRLLAQADTAYWLVYGASRALEVRIQQYELAQRQLYESQLRVQAKSSPRIEITRAESGVAGRMEGIINAMTDLRLAQRSLKRVLNRDDIPMESEIPLNLTSDPQPQGLTLDPASIANLAVENRMEMLELELQLAIDASAVDFQKNARLPLFMFDYQYNINGLGTSYGKAYDQLADSNFNDWSVGLRAEIPLGNHAAKARLQQAVLLRAQRLATKDLRRQVITQEVYNAIDRLRQNWQRILAARQDVLFSTRTYEAERRQFEQGVRTSTDVLDAAERLAIAQLREIQALVDYQIAKVDIAYATGTLLGHANVEWEAVKG